MLKDGYPERRQGKAQPHLAPRRPHGEYPWYCTGVAFVTGFRSFLPGPYSSATVAMPPSNPFSCQHRDENRVLGVREQPSLLFLLSSCIPLDTGSLLSWFQMEITCLCWFSGAGFQQCEFGKKKSVPRVPLWWERTVKVWRLEWESCVFFREIKSLCPDNAILLSRVEILGSVSGANYFGPQGRLRGMLSFL